jgi:hypothetical protein
MWSWGSAGRLWRKKFGQHPPHVCRSHIVLSYCHLLDISTTHPIHLMTHMFVSIYLPSACCPSSYHAAEAAEHRFCLQLAAWPLVILVWCSSLPAADLWTSGHAGKPAAGSTELVPTAPCSMLCGGPLWLFWFSLFVLLQNKSGADMKLVYLFSIARICKF